MKLFQLVIHDYPPANFSLWRNRPPKLKFNLGFVSDLSAISTETAPPGYDTFVWKFGNQNIYLSKYSQIKYRTIHLKYKS